MAIKPLPWQIEPVHVLQQHFASRKLFSSEREEPIKALMVMASGLGKNHYLGSSHQTFPPNTAKSCFFVMIQRFFAKLFVNTAKFLAKNCIFAKFTGTEKTFDNHVDVLFATLQTMRTWKDAFMEDEVFHRGGG